MATYRIHAALRAAMAAAIMGLCAPVCAQKGTPLVPDEVSRARLSVPSAYVVGPNAALPFYRFRIGSFRGRDLDSHQFGALISLDRNTHVSLDHHDIHATGRHAGNRFDSEAFGLAVKRRFRQWERPDTALSLELEYRMAEADAQVDNTLVDPPDADVVTLSASGSRWLDPQHTLHLRGSASRLALGSELDGWSLGFSAGVDRRISGLFTVEGNAAVFTNFGDAEGTEVALSGGVHYGRRTGFVADVCGTLLPTGVPMVGGALADAAVFRMDPTMANQSVVQQLEDGTIGFFSVQVGYRTEW